MRHCQDMSLYAVNTAPLLNLWRTLEALSPDPIPFRHILLTVIIVHHDDYTHISFIEPDNHNRQRRYKPWCWSRKGGRGHAIPPHPHFPPRWKWFLVFSIIINHFKWFSMISPLCSRHKKTLDGPMQWLIDCRSIILIYIHVVPRSTYLLWAKVTLV